MVNTYSIADKELGLEKYYEKLNSGEIARKDDTSEIERDDHCAEKESSAEYYPLKIRNSNVW